MASPKPLDVLVVDDSHDTADSLALFLRASGYAPRVAYSAGEAEKVVAGGFAPDVVFLDIRLPDADGFALAKGLCVSLPRKPLIVAVTGYSETTGKAQREGFDLHFLKPADPQALV